jgi:hypothetical protein
MTSRIPFPVAQWTEPPLSGAAVTLVRIYFTLTGLSTAASDEAARLADVGSTGTYGLYALADIPALTPTLSLVLRNGTDTLLY